MGLDGSWPLRIRVYLAITSLMKRIGPGYVRAHTHASRNRDELLRSGKAGCFYCFETFAPSEIIEWFDDERTAVCPKCGIDSVLGSASGYSIERDFLARMHRRWFERGHRIKLKKR